MKSSEAGRACRMRLTAAASFGKLAAKQEHVMSARPPVFKSSPSNPALGEIQTQPARKPDMPYAPAIRVSAPGELLFISGATPSPLYHKHPHVLSEHNHPVGIEAQTRLA